MAGGYMPVDVCNINKRCEEELNLSGKTKIPVTIYSYQNIKIFSEIFTLNFSS